MLWRISEQEQQLDNLHYILGKRDREIEERKDMYARLLSTQQVTGEVKVKADGVKVEQQKVKPEKANITTEVKPKDLKIMDSIQPVKSEVKPQVVRVKTQKFKVMTEEINVMNEGVKFMNEGVKVTEKHPSYEEYRAADNPEKGQGDIIDEQMSTSLLKAQSKAKKWKNQIISALGTHSNNLSGDLPVKIKAGNDHSLGNNSETGDDNNDTKPADTAVTTLVPTFNCSGNQQGQGISSRFEYSGNCFGFTPTNGKIFAHDLIFFYLFVYH